LAASSPVNPSLASALTQPAKPAASGSLSKIDLYNLSVTKSVLLPPSTIPKTEIVDVAAVVVVPLLFLC